MTEKVIVVMDFVDWNGQPFFKGQPSEGRQAYVAVSPEGSFVAFGLVEGSEATLFQVKGRPSDLQRFLDELGREGAEVTFGAPPINTNTGGDKASTGATKPGSR